VAQAPDQGGDEAMTQREKPGITPEQLNVTLGLPVDSPTIVSGGMIENFREGWAKEAFGGDVAHYFRRNSFDWCVALCGHGTEARWMYGRGNYPCCKRCVRLRDKSQSAARV
jgi:hypothetical protein